MRDRVFPLTGYVALVLITIFPVGVDALGNADELPLASPFAIEPNRFMMRWDLAQHALIFYRDVTDLHTPAIRRYDQGTRPGAPIFPLRDFPYAREFDVWSVAGTPSGGVIASAVLQYEGNRVRHVIASWDSYSRLQRVWDTGAYHHHRIAVDTAGNVYALGHRINKGSDELNYALLVKYSPEGEIVTETLPKDLFRGAAEVVYSHPEMGENELAVLEDRVFVFLAANREVLWLDPNGNVQARYSLVPIFEEISRQTGAEHIQVSCLSIGGGNRLVAQLRLSQENPAESSSFLMVQIFPDSGTWQTLAAVANRADPGLFLGMSQKGEYVFSFRARSRQAMLAFLGELP